MAHHLFVRPAREEDRQQFVDWSIHTPNNLLDPDVIKYSSTRVWCAFDENGPIVYVPVQKPLFMESLAINPEASPALVAMALKELTQNLVTQAHLEGSGELYFLCKDESTIEFSKKQVWKEQPWRVFKIKVKDLESPQNEQI